MSHQKHQGCLLKAGCFRSGTGRRLTGLKTAESEIHGGQRVGKLMRRVKQTQQINDWPTQKWDFEMDYPVIEKPSQVRDQTEWYEWKQKYAR